LQFLPLAFVAALYPALASAFGRSSRLEVSNLVHEGVRYMWLLGVGVAACIGAAAGPLVRGLYGSAYAGSVPVLAILAMQLPFLFISFPLGALLNACDRQRRTTLAMAAAVAVDLGLLVLLYPSYGIVGAAIASLVSTIAMVMVQLRGTKGLVPRDGTTGMSIVMVFLTGVVAFSLGLGFAPALHWFADLVLTAAVFFGLSFLAGTLKRRDLRQLLSVVRRS
jgi:O-antigen/teichoic acid export membrane protein